MSMIVLTLTCPNLSCSCLNVSEAVGEWNKSMESVVICNVMSEHRFLMDLLFLVIRGYQHLTSIYSSFTSCFVQLRYGQNVDRSFWIVDNVVQGEWTKSTSRFRLGLGSPLSSSSPRIRHLCFPVLILFVLGKNL
jgi:hypothetical protein